MNELEPIIGEAAMHLTSITLENYRCFKDRSFTFSPAFNLLVGDNGSGKTALLDAVRTVLGLLLEKITGEENKYPYLCQPDMRKTANPQGIGGPFYHHSPSTLSADATIDEFELSWSQEFDGEELLPDFPDDTLAKLRAWSFGKLVSGGQRVRPLLAYYGTDRSRILPDNLPEYGPHVDPRIANQASSNAPNPRCTLVELANFLSTASRAERAANQDSVCSRAVRTAIASCVPGCAEIRCEPYDGSVLVFMDSGDSFYLEDMSHGARSTLAMVGDIAARAVALNPSLEDRVLLDTSGVVLVDELDLHLHPKWQRRVIGDLKRTFPKIQFIATTHSPFLIQALKPGELIALHEMDMEVQASGAGPHYDVAGEAAYADQSVEDIAEFVMGVRIPQKSQRYLDMVAAAEEYFRLLRQPETDPEKLNASELRLDEVSLPFSDDPAFQALLKLEREARRGEH